MKLIDDKPISPGDIIHKRYEIERYMNCHNALVELYDMFVDNPILSRFLGMAYSGNEADTEHSIIPENFPKVFLMKVAINLMVEYIENSENAYAFTLEDVSQNHDTDDLVADYEEKIKYAISSLKAIIKEASAWPKSVPTQHIQSIAEHTLMYIDKDYCIYDKGGNDDE